MWFARAREAIESRVGDEVYRALAVLHMKRGVEDDEGTSTTEASSGRGTKQHPQNSALRDVFWGTSSHRGNAPVSPRKTRERRADSSMTRPSSWIKPAHCAAVNAGARYDRDRRASGKIEKAMPGNHASIRKTWREQGEKTKVGKWREKGRKWTGRRE